jgi:hypothetical protein
LPSINLLKRGNGQIECIEFLDKKSIECICLFINANLIEDVDELPLGYELDHPMKSAPFV